MNILLAPFAPHLAEEMWEMLGHSESVFDSGWPEWDDAKIVFDTFGRQRDGYYFAVNPAGARTDAIFGKFSDFNKDWDTVWDAEARVDEKGWAAEIEIPFNIPPDLETRIFVTAGGNPPVEPVAETIVFPPEDQYTIQATLFAQAILVDTPVPVPISDAIANMRVIDTILATPGFSRT